MYNKLFDHKQTTLFSISLLALLLSGCSSGLGGGEIRRKVSIKNTAFQINAPKYNQVYTSKTSNKDDSTAYINSKGKPASDLAKLPAENYYFDNENKLQHKRSENQILSFLDLGNGVEINLKQMVNNEKDQELLDFEDRKTPGELKNIICCSYAEDNVDTPFEFLRFGEYWIRGNGNYQEGIGSTEKISAGNYFISGYPTPEKNMPTKGNVYFAGKWYGSASSNDASATSKYADARYLVDFKNKDVQGYLYYEDDGEVTSNVVNDIKVAQDKGKSFDGIKFNAKISGNRFTDNEAKVNWLSVVSDSSAKKKYVTGSAKVEGYFFGTADYPANELGGTISNKDIKLVAVFAGKRTAQQQ